MKFQDLLGRIESVVQSEDGLGVEEIAVVVEVIREIAYPEILRRLAYRNGVTVEAGQIEMIDLLDQASKRG